ncbi:MAG: response regulator, partial [Oscillospiraceae bacterium]|nr:response regulator [Oscillospiraceae bacterium]
INQIILNMLTNAVKYTPKGSVTMTIRARERKEDRILLYVEVKDTGIGIKEDDMSRLFESFERLDEIRNRNIEGTGLGMSIITKLLGLMGSELKVESVYGEGSVFSFELWQKIENEEPLGEFRMISTEEENAGTYHEFFHAPKAHILLVDDTKMNITVAVNLLKKTEVQIDTALSGNEAIELAGKNSYDLILMDQRMPGMDGTQTLNNIRKLENGKNLETPVICLTADAIRGAKERYLAEGFTDYLTKPVDWRSLEKALLKYLPEEKIDKEKRIVETDEFEAEENNDEQNRLIMCMKAAGADVKKGMNFCMNANPSRKSLSSSY